MTKLYRSLLVAVILVVAGLAVCLSGKLDAQPVKLKPVQIIKPKPANDGPICFPPRCPQ